VDGFIDEEVGGGQEIQESRISAKFAVQCFQQQFMKSGKWLITVYLQILKDNNRVNQYLRMRISGSGVGSVVLGEGV